MGAMWEMQWTVGSSPVQSTPCHVPAQPRRISLQGQLPPQACQQIAACAVALQGSSVCTMRLASVVGKHLAPGVELLQPYAVCSVWGSHTCSAESPAVAMPTTLLTPLQYQVLPKEINFTALHLSNQQIFQPFIPSVSLNLIF